MNRVLHLTEEAARCMLCQDAPCSQVCRSGNPARAIRAIRFGNEKLASHWIIDCTDEDLERAERDCPHGFKHHSIQGLCEAVQTIGRFQGSDQF